MAILVIITYLLSLLVFLADIFIYPGFTLGRLGINPLVFLFAYLLTVLFCLFRHSDIQNNKFLKPLFLINERLIFPVSLAAAVFFALLETGNYPNYIYTAYSINHADLAFIVLLSFATLFLQKGRNLVIRNYKKYLLILPLIPILIFWVLTTGVNEPHVQLSKEDGLIEYFQFFLFLFSGILAFKIYKNLQKTNKVFGYIYLFVGVALLLISMEEISWGQRIIGLETPDALNKINEQGEINIHNITVFHRLQFQAYALLGFYGSFSWLLHKSFLKKKLGHLLDLITLPRFLFFFFFPTFLYNSVYVYLVEPYHAWSEFLELTLAAGIFFYILRNYLATSGRTKFDQ
jgi:hypothetical protein